MNPLVLAIAIPVLLAYGALLMISWAADSKQPWNRKKARQ